MDADALVEIAAGPRPGRLKLSMLEMATTVRWLVFHQLQMARQSYW